MSDFVLTASKRRNSDIGDHPLRRPQAGGLLSGTEDLHDARTQGGVGDLGRQDRRAQTQELGLSDELFAPGACYTLDRIARWDGQGLCFYAPAHFWDPSEDRGAFRDDLGRRLHGRGVGSGTGGGSQRTLVAVDGTEVLERGMGALYV